MTLAGFLTYSAALALAAAVPGPGIVAMVARGLGSGFRATLPMALGIGFGDLVVGKQVGQMMGALGGRLGAYRAGLAGGDLKGALLRNVYRGEEPDAAAIDHVESEMRKRAAVLSGCTLDDLKAGRIGL